MILDRLEIENLHGALSLVVNFNDDITMLVGINGCGKTSVLNVIDWLLKPNLARLAVTNYKNLSLSFRLGGVAYVLRASKTPRLLTLELICSEREFQPITVKIVHLDDHEPEAAESFYENLNPESHEFPMWNFLQEVASPVTITLDRTISAEADDSHFFEQVRVGAGRGRPVARSPLVYVQRVTSERFAEYRGKAIQYDEELKARIVMSALQHPEEIFNRKPAKRIAGRDIEALQTKVVKYLSRSIKADNVEQHVNRFFDYSSRISGVGGVGENDEYLVNFLAAQYRQIDNLAKAFNEFDVKNSMAFVELENYLNAVNKFFCDSNKLLYFDESTGRLSFSFIHGNGKRSDKRDISCLSSGEKQILILFTFLAFIAKPGTVFIVDEPELSLHPKWQHEFMELFLKLKPKNTQLILATHSPDIVGKFKWACVGLRGMFDV